LEQMDALSEELSPLIGGASALQRARFFGAQTKLNLRRERYLPSEATLRFARINLETCLGGDLHEDYPYALFEYGFVLVLAGALSEAQGALTSAHSLLRKLGDAAQQVRCLSYLTICARLLGDVDRTQELALESEASARAAEMREYIAAALASQGWVMLSRGEQERARRQVLEALDIWTEFGFYPFEWLAVLPLLRVSLLERDLDAAIRCARALLAPRQSRLPGDASLGLSRALDDYDRGEAEAAWRTLDRVLEELPEGYS
ncbi:MAG: Protein kinase, partial [Myxococcaceae bacterium]|nr:Protein kinase [Myxococcaceae bacterium]